MCSALVGDVSAAEEECCERRRGKGSVVSVVVVVAAVFRWRPVCMGQRHDSSGKEKKQST